MSKSSSPKSPEIDHKIVEIPQDLLLQIHAFIAQSNNYLMTIPVQGDNILQSAELMKKAMELHKELEGLNHE